MKLNAGVKFVLLFTIVLFNVNLLFSQDFFINRNSEVKRLYYVIPPKWVDLNLNESYQFLNNSGFSKIKTTTSGNKEIVTGQINGEDHFYMRKLVFENNIIKEYSDIVMFYQACVLCLANEIKNKMRNNSVMQDVYENSYQSALKSDAEMKEVFYKNHYQSLQKDGINQQLLGDINDFGFKYSNTLKGEDFNIIRNCSLKLDEDQMYNFYSERRVQINEKAYMVGDYNLKNVNQYDLNLMIDVFLLDCKNHNILVKKGKVLTSFEKLEGTILGLSYGINNDTKIELKIDPVQWENSSIPKRWYLIYHELGHDVLNLKHGNGGKMMFNFADKGYSWKEFWEDREYMFESIKRK